MKVWKFPLKPGVCEFAMPPGTPVVHVGDDGSGKPQLWAIEDGSKWRRRSFYVAATGEELPDWATVHVGSFAIPGNPATTPNGVFVGHVFERAAGR